MKTFNGRDTANWNFEHWTKYFDEQDGQLEVHMRKDLDLINEVGPDPKEVEGHYLDEDATLMSVPVYLTAVRFLFATQRYEIEKGATEDRKMLVGHAVYAAYQLGRAHELGYSDDRMMGTTMRIWRAFEVAKGARELLWKERSAVGASVEVIQLHALAERLESELGDWMGYLCKRHNYDPYRKVGLRRFLVGLLAYGFRAAWARLVTRSEAPVGSMAGGIGAGRR